MAEHQAKADHGLRGRLVAAVVGIVSWIGLIFAVVLVSHVVLTVGGANPDNGITSTIREWAQPLALAFRDLFTPPDAKLRVLVNYGLAAVFWLVVRSIVLRLVRRLG